MTPLLREADDPGARAGACGVWGFGFQIRMSALPPRAAPIVAVSVWLCPRRRGISVSTDDEMHFECVFARGVTGTPVTPLLREADDPGARAGACGERESSLFTTYWSESALSS